MRWFLEIAYNGTPFHGWQIQPNAVTVQEELEKCFSTILRQKVEVTGSGRTDTGVHASKQVAHVDLDDALDAEAFFLRANAYLGQDIAIRHFYPVIPHAHARFDAVERGYHYFIRRTKDPFRNGFYWCLRRSLDVAAMNEAAALLLGQQDFTSFSKLHTDTTHNRCHITHAKWEETNEDVCFTIVSNRFLRGMVRAIVGTLVNVGSGKLSVEDFSAIIAAQDRSKASANAPAHGLFLSKVEYPDRILLPS